MNKKRPSIRAIAAEARVSKSTVSLALKGDPRVADETRAHILGIAEGLGYQPNPVVANLMSQLSQSQQQDYKANLALLNIDVEKDALHESEAVADWIRGCERRAGELGYKLDHFWIHDPELTPENLARILRARNISGVLIINSCATPELPDEYRIIWEGFSCLVVGNRVVTPPLNFVCNNQYSTAMESVKIVAEKGYQRPGMIMCNNLDDSVEKKFSAGFVMGHQMMYGTSAIPIIDPAHYEDRKEFEDWYNAYAPDVIISINPWPMDWLSELGVAVPETVALANLDHRPHMQRWAGMNQNGEAIGEASAEQLIAQIHRNEHGIPDIPRALLVGSKWVDGPSLSTQKPPAILA